MTYFELHVMARGRERQAWNHTAFLCAWVAGMFGNKISPTSIHPFAARAARGADVMRVSSREFIQFLAAATKARRV